MTWAVCTHTARRQNARLPYPIRLRSLLVTISMKYAGLNQVILMDETQQAQAELLVESLGRYLNINDLIFDDEDDTCLINFDETNLVTLTWIEEGTLILIDEFITTLSLQDRRDRSEIVERMLDSNVFWMQTKGATLSMHTESGTVIAARQLPVYGHDGMTINAETLGLAITDLMRLASEWRSLLETGESTPTDFETPDEEIPDGEQNDPEELLENRA